ncbi:MAG: glutamate racemase [Crocinitomicaceae bacterium]|nr:glutamate racemase [Crocinitomicaceae bacterium]
MGAIGVFDSGYGGLTILKSLIKELPEHDFIYYGDNHRAPYGTRSFDEVYEFTLEAVIKLFEMGCPLVILACNTASAKALRTIQQKYLPIHYPDRRVLGVIRPSAEVVGELSTSHHIGLLATEGTVRSESYRLELEKFSPHIELFQHACPNWVTLIESGQQATELGKENIQKDVAELLSLSPQIDTIILACTHYPIIADYIASIVPPHVKIIAQGDIVARSLKDYLQRHHEMELRLTKQGTVRYFTSGDPQLFNQQAAAIIHLDTDAQLIE